MIGLRSVFVCTLALVAARTAGGDEPALPSATELYHRLRLVEEQNAQMARELHLLRGDLQSLAERHEALSARVSGRIGGYADIGFFFVGGDGSGIRPDTGHVAFPEYSDVPDSWVFYGDPLAPTINSRGDVATTGPSRAVTYNPVDNGGKPSFIVNSLTLSLFGALGSSLTVNGLVDFLPRNRNVSDPTGLYLGDYVDVKLAYVEYTVPTDRFDLRISVGKIDSTLGIEYRTQESPDRITVTPSLICRYTCGRPTGLKIRGRFFNDLLVAALAVTNGSNVTEQFPFSDEIDVNNFKTVSGRLSTKLPIGAGLELGVSGAFGAQDLQPSDGIYQWHVRRRRAPRHPRRRHSRRVRLRQRRRAIEHDGDAAHRRAARRRASTTRAPTARSRIACSTGSCPTCASTGATRSIAAARASSTSPI